MNKEWRRGRGSAGGPRLARHVLRGGGAALPDGALRADPYPFHFFPFPSGLIYRSLGVASEPSQECLPCFSHRGRSSGLRGGEGKRWRDEGGGARTSP